MYAILIDAIEPGQDYKLVCDVVQGGLKILINIDFDMYSLYTIVACKQTLPS
jgi:hypothetical protein